jgi:signal transduction histidine kinase
VVRTVRARTTLLAALVVATALAIGSVALLVVLRTSLTRSGDAAARTRAADLAALAVGGGLPTTLPPAGEDDVAQVVDGAGRVVAATANATGRPRITTFVPAGTDLAVRTVRLRDGEDREDYRVWVVRAGPGAVYVGRNLDSVDETIDTVRGVLGVGLPPLLVLLAGSTWLLIGRALRPVEAIRAQVSDIGERALDRRVPVPATRDEIGRLARTMNEMLDRLQAADDRQRGFVGDASHELKGPLAAVRTELEVALAHPDRTDWPRLAGELLAEVRDLDRLVHDLLFLARGDSGRDPLVPVPVDLDDVVLDEAARLRGTTRLRVDTAGVSAAPVLGDPGELARLTRNLLENAERHARSTVRVGLSCRDGAAELVVEDDGPGVPPEHRERIFDRFVRLDGARSRDDGAAGLGLAIVAAIAGRHGASVAVTPAGGSGGARFVLRLPPPAGPARRS